MKYFLIIFTSLILFGCDDKTNNNNHSIIGKEFRRFNEIESLLNYTKISDTVIYGNSFEPKHRILHLRDKRNNLILLKSITLDSRNEDKIYKILDTLIIPNLNKPEFITIGYCQLNEENDENLIAIVDKTDSLKIQNIRKLWRANIVTNKIEAVNNLNGINCLNEWFSE